MYARQCVHRLEKGVDRMDDGGPTASIPLFLALLLIEALCYGFGAAIHGLNEKEVERKAIEEGDKKSLLLSRILENPNRYVNTVQLVVTFLNLCMERAYTQDASAACGQGGRPFAFCRRAYHSGIPHPHDDSSALHIAGIGDTHT